MSRLKGEIFYNTLGNISYALSYWVLTVIISKNFSSLELGNFALGLSISAPIVLLFGLQYRSRLSALKIDEVDYNEFVSSRFQLSVICFLIIALVSIPLFSGDKLFFILILGLTKCIEMNSDILFGVLQKNQRLDLVGKSQIAKAVVMVLAFSATIHQGLKFACISMTIVYAFFLLQVDRKLVRRISIIPTISTKFSLDLFKKSLPLGISALFVSANLNIPKYLTEYYFGTKELGVLSAVFYFYVLSVLISNSLGQGALVRLSNIAFKDKQMFRKYALLLVGAFVLVSLAINGGIFFLGDFFIIAFYGETFVSGLELFPAMAAVIFLSNLSGAFTYIILSLSIFNKQIIVTAIMIIASLLGGMYLVPKYGLSGCLFALAFSFLIQTIVYGGMAISRYNSLSWQK